MSAHPYEDTFTTEIHGYFPVYLLGFSVCRVATLLIMQITSKGDSARSMSRPMTEIVGIFCLFSGALMAHCATPEIMEILKDANLSAAVTAAYAMCTAIGMLAILFTLVCFRQSFSNKDSESSTFEALSGQDQCEDEGQK